jgi:hypothetical protein
MLFDNASHLGSFSQVSSIDENPVYEQTSQVVQLWQVSHPQGSGKIQLVGYGDGVGVGVGVGKITSPQMWVLHSHPQVKQELSLQPHPQLPATTELPPQRLHP